MRELEITKQAKKFLAKLPPKQGAQIAEKILSLRTNATPNDAKRLQGVVAWRVDCGEYRITYDVTDDCVIVYVVGKRNDSEVYRLLERKFRG